MITLMEVKQALLSGYHERRKDEYKAEYQAWNYAIRGKSIDQRELRIVVSFEPDTSMLLITAVDLTV